MRRRARPRRRDCVYDMVCIFITSRALTRAVFLKNQECDIFISWVLATLILENMKMSSHLDSVIASLALSPSEEI